MNQLNNQIPEVKNNPPSQKLNNPSLMETTIMWIAVFTAMFFLIHGYISQITIHLINENVFPASWGIFFGLIFFIIDIPFIIYLYGFSKRRSWAISLFKGITVFMWPTLFFTIIFYVKTTNDVYFIFFAFWPIFISLLLWSMAYKILKRLSSENTFK